MIQLEEATKEIHIWSQTPPFNKRKANILECKQDSLGRVYITVDEHETTRTS